MSSQYADGWEESYDEDSGQVYYTNTFTGEVSWELPAVGENNVEWNVAGFEEGIWR